MDQAAKKLRVISASAMAAGISSTQSPAAAVAAAAVYAANDAGKQVVKNVARLASEHPVLATVIVGGAVLTVAPGAVALPVLNALGFTSGGVGAGSAAAVLQSGIGNVSVGSAFAACQSAAAGGAGMATVTGAVQGAGAALGVAAAGGKFLWTRIGGSKAKL